MSKSAGAMTGIAPSTGPVRSGHFRSLEAIGSDRFPAIMDLFASFPEIGGTYFRPGDRGVQPVDLDANSPKPLIGIGPAFSARASVEVLAAQMSSRLAVLAGKRKTLTGSPEKRFEAELIRHAFANELRLPARFPQGLHFVFSQWRFADGRIGRPADLVCIDASSSDAVIIELKRPGESERGARTQAREYAEQFEASSSELVPYFTRVCQVMALRYGAPALAAVTPSGGVRSMVAWPTKAGELFVDEA